MKKHVLSTCALGLALALGMAPMASALVWETPAVAAPVSSSYSLVPATDMRELFELFAEPSYEAIEDIVDNNSDNEDLATYFDDLDLVVSDSLFSLNTIVTAMQETNLPSHDHVAVPLEWAELEEGTLINVYRGPESIVVNFQVTREDDSVIYYKVTYNKKTNRVSTEAGTATDPDCYFSNDVIYRKGTFYIQSIYPVNSGNFPMTMRPNNQNPVYWVGRAMVQEGQLRMSVNYIYANQMHAARLTSSSPNWESGAFPGMPNLLYMNNMLSIDYSGVQPNNVIFTRPEDDEDGIIIFS